MRKRRHLPRSMNRRNGGILQAGLVASQLVGLSAAAQTGFCFLHPVDPPCCPSPCAITDIAKLVKLEGDVEIARQSIASQQQSSQILSTIALSFGNIGRLPVMPITLNGWTDEVTTPQSGLPALPTEAAQSLKQSLFDGVAVSGSNNAENTSTIALRRQKRVAAAAAEQVGSLALGLASLRISAAGTQTGSQTNAQAAGSMNLRGDVAALGAARIAFFDDVTRFQQILAAWLALQATDSALRHGNVAVDSMNGVVAPVSDASASNTQSAASLSARQGFEQLVALHSQRYAAQTILSQYPALQGSQMQYALARRFAIDASARLELQLADWVPDPVSALPAVMSSLKRLDTSQWLDSGSKDLAAQKAAKAVAAAIMIVRPVPGAPVGTDVASRLQQAEADWLAADKQQAYWQRVSDDATRSAELLDQQLGWISDGLGLDITGAEAEVAEADLLTRFASDAQSQPWRRLVEQARLDRAAHNPLIP